MRIDNVSIDVCKRDFLEAKIKELETNTNNVKNIDFMKAIYLDL